MPVRFWILLAKAVALAGLVIIYALRRKGSTWPR